MKKTFTEFQSGLVNFQEADVWYPVFDIKELAVGDYVSGPLDAQAGQSLAEAVDDSPAGHHRVFAAGVVDHRSQVWVGHGLSF